MKPELGADGSDLSGFPEVGGEIWKWIRLQADLLLTAGYAEPPARSERFVISRTVRRRSRHWRRSVDYRAWAKGEGYTPRR